MTPSSCLSRYHLVLLECVRSRMHGSTRAWKSRCSCPFTRPWPGCPNCTSPSESRAHVSTEIAARAAVPSCANDKASKQFSMPGQTARSVDHMATKLGVSYFDTLCTERTRTDMRHHALFFVPAVTHNTLSPTSKHNIAARHRYQREWHRSAQCALLLLQTTSTTKKCAMRRNM